VHSALSKIKGKRVLVVGDVVLDHYVWGDVERISPEAPVPVVRVTREEDMPGAAANVAMNLAALDARPIMLSVVGDDADGARLREMLQSANVDCTYLMARAEGQTTRKARILARSQHVVRVDWDALLSDDAVRKCGVYSALENAVPVCDAVIIQDYNKGLIQPAMFELIASMDVPVIVDPNRYHAMRYRGTVATPNLEEARILAGAQCSSSDAGSHLPALASGMFERHDLEALVITMGERGIALCLKDGTVQTQPAAITHDVYDVSGAGDTVCAVLGAALAAGTELWDACRLANIAGGIVVGKMGTATTTRHEIQALIDSNAPA
jgi:D-beta-D-heptose 7-phosphate kinase/D-beta-D-heptose 1-phosphate adenosyltransferase